MADNLPAPARPQVRNASSKRRLARLFAAGGGFALLVTTVLLVVVWYLAAPKGELRLAIDPSVQVDEDKARVAFSIFQTADTAIDDAQLHHARLSFRDSQDLPISVPSPASPGGNKLADFLTELVVETSADSKSGRIALSLDGVAVLEALYGIVGWHDHFLVIRELEEEECRDQVQASCYRIVAQLSPSSLRPDEFHGTISSIGRDLAVLTLRGAIRKASVDWREQNEARETAPPFLLAASTPTRMSALEATSEGISILELGPAHRDCRQITKAACLETAQRVFERAIDQSREGTANNASAAMGLGLIEIAKALSGARDLRPDREIEQHLQSANRWITQARRSQFLRLEMARLSVTDRFDILNIDELKLDEGLFELVENYHCSLVRHRRADWHGCLERMGDLELYPAPVRPYLEAARFEARLHLAPDLETRVAILDSVSDVLWAPGVGLKNDQDLRRWLLQRVALRHVCLHPEDMVLEKFKRLVDAVIDDAPSEHDHYEVTIEAAACDHAVDFPASSEVEKIINHLGSLSAEEGRYRLELALAKYYVRVNDLDAAVARVKQALELPYAGSFVRNSPAFRPLMSSRHHKRDFIRSSFDLPKDQAFAACLLLEF